MEFEDHLRTTGGALKNWFIAQFYDALAVAGLWFVGLKLLHIPWALLWALLGGALQFIPGIGTAVAVLGPALSAGLSRGWEPFLFVLMLYAGIVMIDGFVLQPLLMKRTARVPVWASLLTPIVLGIMIPFWGVLLSPPLLAVVFAYRARK
jgi:predicted PurR-regulated permease PerM